MLASPAAFGQVADCNTNGVADAADIEAGTSPDCNATGVPDECELSAPVEFESESLSPIAGGMPVGVTFDTPAAAVSEATIRVEAVADLSAATESIDVLLDGMNVGTLFAAGGTDCPESPDVAELAVPAGDFNAAAADGQVTVELVPTDAVDNACSPTSRATVTLSYLVFRDCDSNGVPDECERDCNENGIPDACDLAAESSGDCDADGVPDECQPDCDGNGTADTCDIAAGDAADCNDNAAPDDCELASGAVSDCNGNGIPDDCDAAGTVSPDCNANGVPDECELAFRDALVAIRQPPDQTTGIFADADCQSCNPLTEQSAAANFSIDAPLLVGRINLWGGYFPVNQPPSSDRFTVVFHVVSAGLPGRPLSVQTNLQTRRMPTEDTLFEDTEEWFFELTLREPVALEPGSYFVEIFNNTQDSEETFVWELGQQSSAAGLPGAAFAGEAPGSGWRIAEDTDLAFELVAGREGDCNNNRIPDDCDIVNTISRDCNDNATPDECETDCNENGVADECDIAGGTSDDCDDNGTPDECQPDCDNSGIADACDIASGDSDDCNDNGTPDECELDCNENGTADSCDIEFGDSDDCNNNRVPDECEVDSDNDGIIDACEGPDSDGDGVANDGDVCPDTPAGVAVDETGCPVSGGGFLGINCGEGACGATGMIAMGAILMGFIGLRRRVTCIGIRTGKLTATGELFHPDQLRSRRRRSWPESGAA